MRAILALALLLAACDTDARWAAADRRDCTRYGFTAGTEGYAGCLMKLDVARKQRIVDAFRN